MSLNQKSMNPILAINPSWKPISGPFTRWPRTADAMLAVLVFLLMVFTSTEGQSQDITFRTLNEVSKSEIFIFFIAAVALYGRREKPLSVLGITLVLTILSAGLGQSACLASLPIALYSVGRYESNDRWSQFAVEATVLLLGIKMFFTHETLVDFVTGMSTLFVLWFFGTRIRLRGEHLQSLQERAIQLEREREAESERAVAEERTRIARELHDVVAHRVSLMTVQASAAKTVAADKPEVALKAMEAVEIAGRQALDELRQLVGILRPCSGSEKLGPQSGLSEIPQLIEGFKQAGLDITLQVKNQLVDLPSHVDLSTYRIVQEALTNVLKHAGPGAITRVEISCNDKWVIVTVRDSGQGITILPGSGHGIAGMRERAQLLGGSFKAGLLQGGGFEVVAHLPLEVNCK